MQTGSSKKDSCLNLKSLIYCLNSRVIRDTLLPLVSSDHYKAQTDALSEFSREHFKVLMAVAAALYKLKATTLHFLNGGRF